MILCWLDQRNGFKDIYAQRLNSNGQKLWINQGMPVCNSDSASGYQRIATDDAGGAIICWQDKRSGNNDIYAQHIDSLGNVKWTLNGMPVCTAITAQEYPHITDSDSGTAIIVWNDNRSGWARGYAQKVGDEAEGVEGQQNAECGMRNAEYRLMKNYPNPFSNTTVVIGYQLSAKSHVKLAVYNVAGQLVKTLVNEVKASGFHTTTWNAKDKNGNKVSSGVYFYRLTVDNRDSITKKLIIVR